MCATNNPAALQQGSDPEDLFGFKINYNTIEGSATAANKLYNGNIAETFWSTATDGGFVRNYGYKYDQLNRLKDATYQKSNVVTNMYNENLTYDKNGNIMTLKRNGDRDVQTGTIGIDNLSYGYATNSNKLMSVVDNTNNTSGFNDFNKSGNDYAYDVNGNMTLDKNKKITAITYNHLNLPTKIVFATGNIVYIYNAAGQKVQKVVTTTTPASVVTTDYLGGYQYKNTVLQYFPTAEGYVKNTPMGSTNAYSYVFNYTDHLGNVRLSYTKNPSTNVLTILEESNYYPFGLKHNGYNPISPIPENRRLFNGKELQEELSLNLYDYGARNYDPALGRWMNIDPLAEISRRFSPYTYALDNPVYFIDVDGMYADPGDFYTKDGKYLGNDGKNDNKVYVADSKNKDGTFNNSKELSVTHYEFATSANVVKHESSGNKDESLWIAHTANNAKDNNAIDYKKQNKTLNDQLTDQNYSTTPSSARTPLAVKDASLSANNARAAVIDVLSGGADPTGGAVLWDGSDFLSKGASHNKFKEFKSIDIDAGSLNTYSSSQKVTPNSIFSTAINDNKSFSASGKSGRIYSLHSTGAEGKSIFWKINK